jgi:hypothetical protein
MPCQKIVNWHDQFFLFLKQFKKSAFSESILCPVLFRETTETRLMMSGPWFSV